jgi:hypothetical protein
LFDVEASILADPRRGLFIPLLLLFVVVVPLMDVCSCVVGETSAVVGRCCFSFEGRFSLSLLVDGRVLDETTFGANDDGIFCVSATPLLFVVRTSDASA